MNYPRIRARTCSACEGKQRSEEHTSELQSLAYLVCRLLLEKKKTSREHEEADLAQEPTREQPDCFLHERVHGVVIIVVFFFNDTATTEIYTLSLHDALPIFGRPWLPSRYLGESVGDELPANQGQDVLRVRGET